MSAGSATGTAETASIARRDVEAFGFLPGGAANRGKNGLSDARTTLDDEGFAAGIEQNDADFAAVVLIDGAGGVGQGDAVAQGETGSWADLEFVTRWQGDGQAGRNQQALTGFDGDRLADGRDEVHAGGAGGGIGRQRQACGMRQAADLDGNRHRIIVPLAVIIRQAEVAGAWPDCSAWRDGWAESVSHEARQGVT